MKKIALFEKISLKQFILDCENLDIDIEKAYQSIILPTRATKFSAGYDFVIPFDLILKANQEIIVPTGIRAKIDNDYVLCIFPRSSLGFKYGMSLSNTVGIIDADYYNAKNEGHIKIKIKNNSNNDIVLKNQDRFVQGIFLNYGITLDDDVENERIGGIGSTNQ